MRKHHTHKCHACGLERACDLPECEHPTVRVARCMTSCNRPPLVVLGFSSFVQRAPLPVSASERRRMHGLAQADGVD